MPSSESAKVVDASRQRLSVVGCLLGTAVGDALGLPYEALSRRRQQKLYAEITGHALILGHGMISDDTEHLCMVAQALLASAGDPVIFARSLGWRLRFWLLSFPPAIGLATLRAVLKLWLGFPPSRSGVFSAGNGPAMRSAILGVCFGEDTPRLRQLVRVSTRITHTDPKAEWAALAVAVAAYVSSLPGEVSSATFLEAFRRVLGGDVEQAQELLGLLEAAAQSAEGGETPRQFAVSLRLANGVSGYAYHTVPVAIQVWLRWPDDFSTVIEAIRCGGDTDTVAAIVGGILGARLGSDGIPPAWLENIWEWPRSPAWIERLGDQLARTGATKTTGKAIPLPVWALPLRSLVFTIIILAHGFRRLLPPY